MDRFCLNVYKTCILGQEEKVILKNYKKSKIYLYLCWACSLYLLSIGYSVYLSKSEIWSPLGSLVSKLGLNVRNSKNVAPEGTCLWAVAGASYNQCSRCKLPYSNEHFIIRSASKQFNKRITKIGLRDVVGGGERFKKEVLSNPISFERCPSSTVCNIQTNSVPKDIREKVCDNICRSLFYFNNLNKITT